MSAPLAAAVQSFGMFGLLPVAVSVTGIIVNVSSFQTKDMNRRSGHATNLLFLALLTESSAWMVRSFGGATETGFFCAILAAALLHALSGIVALGAFWQHRTVGRWPFGRRRATWGVWLNGLALLAIAAWFFLCSDPRLLKRAFD